MVTYYLPETNSENKDPLINYLTCKIRKIINLSRWFYDMRTRNIKTTFFTQKNT